MRRSEKPPISFSHCLVVTRPDTSKKIVARAASTLTAASKRVVAAATDPDIAYQCRRPARRPGAPAAAPRSLTTPLRLPRPCGAPTTPRPDSLLAAAIGAAELDAVE
jgi:hypothetical protein